MSQNEEDALTRSVKLLLGEKGEILWWKRNRNSPHQTQNTKRSSQYRRSQSLPEYDGMAERSQIGIDQRPINPNECTLLLKTRLHYGKISYRDEDENKKMEVWKPPKELEVDLMKKWRSTADAELLIYQEHKTGRHRVVVNEESLLTQVGGSLKETFQSVGASRCLPMLGKKNTHPPDNTGDDMGLD